MFSNKINLLGFAKRKTHAPAGYVHLAEGPSSATAHAVHADSSDFGLLDLPAVPTHSVTRAKQPKLIGDVADALHALRSGLAVKPSLEDVGAARKFFMDKRGTEAFLHGIDTLASRAIIARGNGELGKALKYQVAFAASFSAWFGLLGVHGLVAAGRTVVATHRASRGLTPAQVDRHRFMTALNKAELAIARVNTQGKDALFAGDLTPGDLAHFFQSTKAELAALGEMPEAKVGDTGALGLARAKIALRTCEKRLARLK